MSVTYDKELKEIEKEESPNLTQLMSKITSLSLAVETLTTENNHLLSELEKSSHLETVPDSEVPVLEVNSVVLEQTPVCARDIALKAEIKAMDFVFPECRKKPYCLRSYGNLISFVSNPTDEYTGHTAPTQWAELDELVKQDIRSKIDDVSNHSEYLKTHIKDLKYGGELTTQVCSNVDGIKELFRKRNEEELLESLEECLNFLEAKLYSNIIIKQYRNATSNVRSFGDDKPLVKTTDETSILSSSNIMSRNTVNFLRGFSRGF